jgi:glycosyltransferase involved in cell wall biosynthesis
MAPKISVVIPLYNKELHITRAINSVLCQTCQDFEIIVINDGSTDKSADIVRSFEDSRIRLINQKNRGVSFTRNQGVKCAQSNFIAFLDADDEWMPRHLETLLRLNKRFPNAGIYVTTYKICLKSGRIINANYRAIPKPPFEGLLPNYFKSAALGDPPVCSSVVEIPKEVFFEIGGFQVGEGMGEDLDFWAKIALNFPVAFSSEIGAIYHTDASNRACEFYQLISEEPLVKNGKKMIADGIVPKNVLPFFKEYIARKEIEIANRNIYGDNRLLAQKILTKIDTKYFWKEKLFWMIMLKLPKRIFEFIIRIKRLLVKCE